MICVHTQRKIEKSKVNSVEMSSDVDDDQVLPESLQKLEIVPVYSHPQSICKANNERNQNPFFTELSTANGIDERVREFVVCAGQNEPIKMSKLFVIYSNLDNQRFVWTIM